MKIKPILLNVGIFLMGGSFGAIVYRLSNGNMIDTILSLMFLAGIVLYVRSVADQDDW